MNCLTIYQDNFFDSTMISNHFIDNYMMDANDAQLKIYLYLVRIMSARLSTSVSDIADKFNHTEKDVIRALTYWEKQKLLSLDYDAAKNLCGIHLLKMKEVCLPSQEKPTAEIVPILSVLPTSSTSVAACTHTTSTCVVTPNQEKRTYSLDQLKQFKENPETQQLLFIVEQYIGKPLSPSDMKTVVFLYDHLHFSIDLIDYLVQYCVDRGKKDFKYIEKVALSWSDASVTSVKEASSLIDKYDKNIYSIMKALGKFDTTPTAGEIEFIRKWTNQLAFSLDIILEACSKSVMATDKHRFEYTDGILSNWKKEQVHTLADIKSLDEQYKNRKTSNSKGTKTTQQNSFNQFKQNDYNFAEIEKALLRK